MDLRAGAVTSAPPAGRTVPPWATLSGILLAALVLRIGIVALLNGKQTLDLAIFVSWVSLLTKYGTHSAYVHPGLLGYSINYPPLSVLLLAGIGAVAHRFFPAGAGNDRVLVALLKAPPIVADLAFCWLAYAIVRRWAGPKVALGAAAVAAFAPTTWPLSAYWGQIDSIATTLTLLALALVTWRHYTSAWIVLALAILVKPFPIVLAPLLLAAQLRSQGWSLRMLAGPVIALVMAYAASLPFAPSARPDAALQWLVAQYAAGSSLSHSTSENAYNVWTLFGSATSDTRTILGVTLHAWGWVAFAALVAGTTIAFLRALPASRHQTEYQLFRAAFVVLTGMFVLLTEMHERYILYALALLPLIWCCGSLWERRAAVTLTTTFVVCVVLTQGLYEHAHVPEILLLTHLLSAINVSALAVVAIALLRQDEPAAGRE